MRRSSPPLHPRSDSALPPSLAKGVLGTVTQLQKKKFSTQPIASFDWHADKEGLAVMGVLDQTVRVLLCTKLNLV